MKHTDPNETQPIRTVQQRNHERYLARKITKTIKCRDCDNLVVMPKKVCDACAVRLNKERYARYEAQNPRQVVKQAPRLCECGCGTEFTPKRSNHFFINDEHRRKTWHANCKDMRANKLPDDMLEERIKRDQSIRAGAGDKPLPDVIPAAVTGCALKPWMVRILRIHRPELLRDKVTA